MASAAKSFARAIPRSSPASSIRLAARSSRTPLAQQFFQSSRRQYSSGPGAAKSKAGLYVGAGLVSAAGAGAFYYFNKQDVHLKKGSSGETKGIFKPTKEDYQQVYNEIARLLVEKDDY